LPSSFSTVLPPFRQASRSFRDLFLLPLGTPPLLTLFFTAARRHITSSPFRSSLCCGHGLPHLFLHVIRGNPRPFSPRLNIPKLFSEAVIETPTTQLSVFFLASCCVPPPRQILPYPLPPSSPSPTRRTFFTVLYPSLM